MRYPILQPNGQIAIWSTIVDTFLRVNLTIEDAANQLQAHELTFFEGKEREEAAKSNEYLEWVQATANATHTPPYPYMLTWAEALSTAIACHIDSNTLDQRIITAAQISDRETVADIIKRIKKDRPIYEIAPTGNNFTLLEALHKG